MHLRRYPAHFLGICTEDVGGCILVGMMNENDHVVTATRKVKITFFNLSDSFQITVSRVF